MNNGDIVAIIVPLLMFAAPLIVFGLITGRTIEKRHFRRLEEFESAHRDFLVTQIRSFPQATVADPPPSLLVAEVVIASDVLKSWFAQWRNLFGGEVRSFQTLQTRAKREAIVRLTRSAIEQGYTAMCNVRIEPVDVGGALSKRKTPMAAVLATATAYHVDRPT